MHSHIIMGGKSNQNTTTTTTTTSTSTSTASTSKTADHDALGLNSTPKFAVMDYPGISQPTLSSAVLPPVPPAAVVVGADPPAKTTPFLEKEAAAAIPTKKIKKSTSTPNHTGAAAAAALAGTAASATPSPVVPWKWTLLNPRWDSSATLKVVWASTLFQVPLGPPPTTTTTPSSSSLGPDLFTTTTTTTTTSVLMHHHHHHHHPPLGTAASLGGGHPPLLTVAGGGNAMAQAVASLAPSSSRSLAERLLIDEWCEWERTVLRPAVHAHLATPGSPPLVAALTHLAQALVQGSTPLHIVGHADTVADVGLLSTLAPLLWSADDIKEESPLLTTAATFSSLPAALQRYGQAHAESYAQARRALQQIVAASPALSSPPSNAATLATTTTKSPSTTIDWEEPSFTKVLDQLFRQVVAQLYGPVGQQALEPGKLIVTKCQNPKHGDYQCTAAMPTFAALKKEAEAPASPQQVAQAIIQSLGPEHPVVMELSTTGPGFVMCRLRPTFLQHHVQHLLHTGRLPWPRILARQTCVVDFSSPNIAKEMHVGHLRSTIIGEAVCRILEAVGHDVHRINHVGDWGTQFGMLIQYLREEYPTVAAAPEGTATATLEGAAPNITDLTEFYKAAKQRFDDPDRPDFKKMAQTNVVQLQAGDPSCRAMWRLLCDISRQEFEKVYRRLDVTVQECGESFYNEQIPAVIEEFERAGKIRVEEGGAKCVFTDQAAIPLMLQKSDGGYGYDSTDMAALKYRLQVLKADRIIVITDFSQGDHFKMVYAAGRDIGWLDRGQRLEHIGFGTVMGEDGKRFKTRSGETVRLVDLLDEAVSRMEETLKERMAEGKANITMEEVHGVAEAIGYGAVKYFDLKRNPTTNYKFSYDQMLDTKGDTALYLLYTRVRLESIAAKAKAEYQVDVEELIKSASNEGSTDAPMIRLEHESERNLALHLLVFADTMEQTLDDLFPYHICDYVYKLANAASDFVTQCKVLGSPEMHSRLLLCHATVLAMKQSFDLLGIRHVTRI